MKYERIKFYYIVWAILGFGLKHTLTHTQRNVRTANKRKVQSQTITLSINKNPAHTHTHTRGTASLLEINDGNVSVTVTWAPHPQAFPVISHTKLSTGNFELRSVGVRRRVRLGLCIGYPEFVIMKFQHGISVAGTHFSKQIFQTSLDIKKKNYSKVVFKNASNSSCGDSKINKET